jgi:hypothetical protein
MCLSKISRLLTADSLLTFLTERMKSSKSSASGVRLGTRKSSQVYDYNNIGLPFILRLPTNMKPYRPYLRVTMKGAFIKCLKEILF